MSTVSIANAETRTEGLTREGIAREALAFVDRDGLAALSMRRLAREVGAGTMTLYGYFRDKDDLLDAVVEAAAATYAIERPTGDWRERLMYVSRQLHRGLASHPGLVQLRLSRPIVTPAAMRGTEIAMEALVEAGLDDRGAASAFRVIFLYVFGFTAFSAPELTPDLRREAMAATSTLPESDFPIVSRAAADMVDTLGGEAEFDRGLGLILGGIAEQAKRPG